MKRYGTIDEQVASILFLASDEMSYITGQILPVSGGDSRKNTEGVYFSRKND
jgi:dihydroxycyclohexadiene carboxylate dehydrogenase